ncbi:amidohydrolase [Niallia circulans]|uniref:Amidohydrolase n=1 Tax=Niallia circulans TaxID=1397 RepID=A0A553SGI6_NIACI|nr:amidohydrolase [Niallia circulans]TRZ36090.1 amidohydrolase [Niallia circulans]
MLQSWHEELEGMFDQMVEWRRHMHQYPELSFQEVETPKMIADILEGFGIEVRRNVGGRGVVGKIYGAKPGKTIALRADFDALPIQDGKEVSYKSKVDGVMHACGHDGHTATLLAVAKVLQDNKESIAGNIVLLHQHAEELSPGGAKAMIEDDCLEGVDVVFGTHLSSLSELGKYYCKPGYSQAAADAFEITVTGKGGHGSSPHETVDAIAVGTALVTQLQFIASRRVDPLNPVVLSVGSFHSGNAKNVIASKATLTGTVRTLDKDLRVFMEEEIRLMAESICESMQATCEVNYIKGYPAVFNHEEEVAVFEKAIADSLDKEMVVRSSPIMGAEDFSYYLLEKPGMFFHTGARVEGAQSYPHHHPMFDFDEKAMIYAGKAFLSIVDHYIAVKSEEEVAEAVQ